MIEVVRRKPSLDLPAAPRTDERLDPQHVRA